MLTLWPYIRTNKSRHPRHVFHEALFQLLGSQGFLLGGLEEGVKKWVGSRVSTMKKIGAEPRKWRLNHQK